MISQEGFKEYKDNLPKLNNQLEDEREKSLAEFEVLRNNNPLTLEQKELISTVNILIGDYMESLGIIKITIPEEMYLFLENDHKEREGCYDGEIDRMTFFNNQKMRSVLHESLHYVSSGLRSNTLNELLQQRVNGKTGFENLLINILTEDNIDYDIGGNFLNEAITDLLSLGIGKNHINHPSLGYQKESEFIVHLLLDIEKKEGKSGKEILNDVSKWYFSNNTISFYKMIARLYGFKLAKYLAEQKTQITSDSISSQVNDLYEKFGIKNI